MLIKEDFNIEKQPFSINKNISLNNPNLENIINKLENLQLNNQSLKVNEKSSYFKTNKRYNLTKKLVGSLNYYCLKMESDLYFLEINCKHYPVEKSKRTFNSEYISCKLNLSVKPEFNIKKHEYLNLMIYILKVKKFLEKSYNPISKKQEEEYSKGLDIIFGK